MFLAKVDIAILTKHTWCRVIFLSYLQLLQHMTNTDNYRRVILPCIETSLGSLLSRSQNAVNTCARIHGEERSYQRLVCPHFRVVFTLCVPLSIIPSLLTAFIHVALKYVPNFYSSGTHTQTNTHVFITTCIFLLVTIGTIELLELGGSPLLFKRWKEMQKPYWKTGNMASEFTLLFSKFFSYISHNKIRGNIEIKRELQFIQFRKRWKLWEVYWWQLQAHKQGIYKSTVEKNFWTISATSKCKIWFIVPPLLIITWIFVSTIHRSSCIH
jgi:hypothetical protein